MHLALGHWDLTRALVQKAIESGDDVAPEVQNPATGAGDLDNMLAGQPLRLRYGRRANWTISTV